MSSPDAENMIPISRHCLLLITPGEPTTHWASATRQDVLEANMRTYGWADRYIFGSSQEVVARVRRHAKKNKRFIKRPKPHRQTMLVGTVDGDETLADLHRKRGWPPYLAHVDEFGNHERMDYLVVGEDGTAVELGTTAGELAKKRGQSSVSDEKAVESAD